MTGLKISKNWPAFILLLCMLRQPAIFNYDKTGQFWKKMLNRTSQQKKMPGHKPIKDRLTLALCANMSTNANVSGNCKINLLLVYPFKNPVAFK